MSKDEGEMSMATKKGPCHICGKYTNLTFEHIPPRRALNSEPARVYSGVEVLQNKQKNSIDDTVGLRYQNQQQGVGRHTLCRRCNNNTGSHYASHYIDFAMSVAYLLKRENTNGAVGVHLETKEMNCLAVFKQIISMFCSTSAPGALGTEFREFLLEKENIEFDRERWGVHLYINMGGRSGSSGLLSLFFQQSGVELEQQPSLFTLNVCEIATYPLGMILLDRCSPYQPQIDQIGPDITGMSNLRYGEKPHTIMDLPYRNKPAFMPHNLMIK